MDIKERRKRLLLGTAGVLALCLMYVLFIEYGPLDKSCKLYKLTGFSCSGCGITRMGHAIVSGQFYQALRYNPFIFLSIPVIIGLYLFGAYRYIRYNSKNDWIIRALLIYAVLLFAFGIIRNVPIFHWLLPTELN